MARARIFRQPKSSMQSGRAAEEEWILEWERTEPREADPIMGWFGSGDMRSQLRLKFETREAAMAYAAREDLAVEVAIDPPRVHRPKAYADNFRYARTQNWTH